MNGLGAEHEADMAVGNLAAPAAQGVAASGDVVVEAAAAGADVARSWTPLVAARRRGAAA